MFSSAYQIKFIALGCTSILPTELLYSPGTEMLLLPKALPDPFNKIKLPFYDP